MKRYILFASLFLLCIAGLSFLPAQSGTVPGRITIAAEPDYPPYSFIDETGNAAGFSVELFKAAAQAMGIDVRIETGLWSVIKEKLAQGKIDALPLVGRTPEREELFDFTVPYLSLYGGIVVREENREIRSFEDLQGKKIAVMKNDNAEEFLHRREEAYNIITTPTFKEALDLLSEGESDAVLIQRLVAIRLLQEAGYPELRLLDGPISDFRQDFCFAVQEGDKELLALLNEGLSLIIADGTFRRLQTEWFGAGEIPGRKIVVGGDHNYPPFEFMDEEGSAAGYNVDLTRAIAREMGLDIEIRLGPWSRMTEMLQHGEIDILQGMMYSPERDRLFDFSQTHTVHHHIIVGRKEAAAFPDSPEELKGKTVAVQEGDIMHSFALDHGLAGQLIAVDSQAEALQMVTAGEADFALAGRLTAMHLIEKEGWDNLAVGKKSLASHEYSYAVQEGNRVLLSYFSEGLAVLQESGEYRRIYDKWLGVYEPFAPDYRDIIRIAAFILTPFALIFAGTVFWNRSLRHQVAIRTGELQEREKLFRLLSENTLDVVWLLTPDLYVRYINPSISLLTGESPDSWIGTHAGIHFDKEMFATLAESVDKAALRKPDNGAFTVETEIKSREGSRVCVEISGKILRNRDGAIEGIQGVARDISERKRYEKSLQEGFQRQQWINSLASMYLSRNSADFLVQKTVEQLQNHFTDLRVAYFTLDKAGILKCIYSLQPEGMKDISGLVMDLSFAARYREALQSGERTVISNVDSDPLLTTLRKELAEKQTKAMAAVPVQVEGMAQGLISFTAGKPCTWSEHELLTLEEHANLLTLILDNAKYQELMEEANKNLALSLEEKKTLLKEVHHRVKNNLNVIVSLLRLQEDQIASVESAKEAFDQSRNRIFSMALVHESLYRSDNLSEIELDGYIRSLMEQLKDNIAGDKAISYRFDLETVNIDISRAVPCGIIINELVTNAQKHAFSDRKGGEISISLKNGNGSFIILTVEDDGKGIPPGFSFEESPALGMKLVHLLSDQIDGELEIKGDNGTKVVLKLPLSAEGG